MKKLCRIALVMFLLGLGLVYPAPDAFACSCAGEPSDEVALRRTAMVFTGTATDSVGAFLGGGSNAYGFEVDRAYKGEVRSDQWVNTGSGGGDCGYEFRLGERYAVFAHTEDGEGFYTSICTNTRGIGHDAELDLAATGNLVPGRSRRSPPDIFLALLAVAAGVFAYRLGKKHHSA